MSTRQLKRVSLEFTLLCIFFTGCHLKLNEPVFNDAKVEIQSSKCLKVAKEYTRIYFNGNASFDQAEFAVDCYSKLLVSFKENVKGSSSDGFYPDEIKKIVDSNFLNDGQVISMDLILQILKLKKTLVGGADHYLTKNEILNLSNLLLQIKPQLVRLTPYIDFLKLNWDHQNLSDSDKEQKYALAIENTEQLILTLVNQFDGNEQYRISDLVELIHQITIFAELDSEVVTRLTHAKALAVAYKTGFLGGDDLTSATDWIKVANNVTFFIRQFYQYYYFVSEVSQNINQQQIKITLQIVNDVLSFWGDTLSEKATRIITAQELQYLIESFFLFTNQYKVNDAFAVDVINLKNVFAPFIEKDFAKKLSYESVSYDDFYRIHAKVKSAEQDIVGLFRQIDLLNLDLPYEQFRSEELVTLATINRILQNIEGSYSLFSAQRLIKDILNSGLIRDTEIPDQYDQWYQVILSAKYLVYGQQGAILNQDELRKFIFLGAQFYFNYQEYDFYLKNLEYHDIDFAHRAQGLVNKIQKELVQILLEKPSKVFSKLELQSLFYSSKPVIFQDLKLTISGFDVILNVLFENVLVRPESRLNGDVHNSLNLEAIQILVEEVQYVLSTLRSVFNSITEANDILFIKYRDILSQRVIDTELTGPEILSLQEMLRVTASGFSYHFNELDFIRFFEDTEMITSQKDILRSIFAKSFSRILIRSFSTDLNRIQELAGVTLLEAQAGFDKIRPALIELELVQKSNLTFISSRFRESNLFLASSNGDEYASLEELHDLILHIYSGLNRASMIEGQVVDVCLPGFEGDVKPETVVSQDCLLEQYFNIVDGYQGFPQFLALKTTETKDNNLKFYLSMLKAAGHVPQDNNTVQFSDANLYPHVIQYIEMLFSRFDTNQNKILEVDEALKAYPVFKPIIKSVVVNFKNGDKITDEQMPGVFMYLLKYKKTPVTGKDYLILAGYLTDSKRWDVRANRFDLGDIFNFIADATAPKPVP